MKLAVKKLKKSIKNRNPEITQFTVNYYIINR